MKAIEAFGKIDEGGHLILNDVFTSKNKRVKVILLVPEEGESDEIDEEAEDWYRLSAEGFLRAYSDDEPEYSLDDVIEPNPEFKQ